MVNPRLIGHMARTSARCNYITWILGYNLNSIWIVVYHLQNTLETLWRYCPFWSLVASPPSRISRGRKLIFIFSFFLTIYSIYSGARPWPCANAPTTLQENLDLISKSLLTPHCYLYIFVGRQDHWSGRRTGRHPPGEVSTWRCVWWWWWWSPWWSGVWRWWSWRW